MPSVWRLLPLLLLGACVDLAAPVKVIDQPEVGAFLDMRDGPARDSHPDRPAPPQDSGDTAIPPAADADADADPPPPDLAPARSNGEACAQASDCQSGLCADGLCCDTACTGPCLACDRPEQPGRCTPVPAGEDPKEDCALEPASSCGRDGFCDGQGACRRYPENSTCAPGGCSNASEQAASTCRGGVCVAGSTRSCAPGVCMGASCGTTCSGPGDCQAGFYCGGGKCQARRANGQTCAAASECDSGVCVDGVCCNTACGATCQACNLPGKLGSCSPIADGADPAAECPAQAGTPCGRTGGCNGGGACRLGAAGTTCGAASCSAGRETTAATCNGAGTCSPGSARDCGAFLCGTSSCRTSCSSVADCKSASKCTGGVCLPNKIASLTVHDQLRRSDWSVRADFSIGSAGAHPWAEWGNTYITQTDPAGTILLGNEWLRVATDSKEYTAGPQATLTLGTAGDVYLMVDDRWGASPAFTSGWTNTGWKIRAYESATRPSLPFSVYRKVAQTGPVSLPAIGDTTAYNYFVIVH